MQLKRNRICLGPEQLHTNKKVDICAKCKKTKELISTTGSSQQIKKDYPIKLYGLRDCHINFVYIVIIQSHVNFCPPEEYMGHSLFYW
jgi:hypothetical protein